MSLILEALRKSEAERRRGETPGLRAELPPVARAARRSLPPWIWITCAALVLALLLVALWLRGNGTAIEDGHGDHGARATKAPAAYAVSATPSASMPAAGDSDPFPRVDRITPPEPPSRMPPEPDAAAPSPPAGPAQAAPPAAAGDTVAASDTADTADTAPAPRPVLAPASGAVRITQLPSAQRQRLPAMKLTMHMWNEDPARRFVVIDGQRKSEGDRVGEAGITAIDRDGVLLELDGRPIRVPLP